MSVQGPSRRHLHVQCKITQLDKRNALCSGGCDRAQTILVHGQKRVLPFYFPTVLDKLRTWIGHKTVAIF
jgi:hypothetical protein